MVHVIDQKLRDEAGRFHLVFACPDCVSFDPVNERCTLGFPHGPHHEARLEGRAEITFCKTFELV